MAMPAAAGMVLMQPYGGMPMAYVPVMMLPYGAGMAQPAAATGAPAAVLCMINEVELLSQHVADCEKAGGTVMAVGEAPSSAD
jgi:hypothetical protein